jgi:hypothetical protein
MMGVCSARLASLHTEKTEETQQKGFQEGAIAQELLQEGELGVADELLGTDGLNSDHRFCVVFPTQS